MSKEVSSADGRNHCGRYNYVLNGRREKQRNLFMYSDSLSRQAFLPSLQKNIEVQHFHTNFVGTIFFFPFLKTNLELFFPQIFERGVAKIASYNVMDFSYNFFSLNSVFIFKLPLNQSTLYCDSSRRKNVDFDCQLKRSEQTGTRRSSLIQANYFECSVHLLNLHFFFSQFSPPHFLLFDFSF